MASAREYRLVARIAETEAGQTYRAVATGPGGREPARVLLLAPWATEPDVLEGLVSRVALIAQVRFPNLLVPFELGWVGDRLAVASPAPPGVTLGALMASISSGDLALELDRALHIVAEAANGLAGLHQAGLVHGGIGPGDVAIGRDGSVRLACDGIGLALDMAAAGRGQPGRKALAHRAPELSRGASPDGPADVHALGAVAFELVTGTTVVAARAAVADSDPPEEIRRPSVIDPRIPARLDDLLLPAIALDPGKRPADGAAFRDAIWEYLDGMGQVVTPAQLTEVAAALPGDRSAAPEFDPDEASAEDVPRRTSFSLRSAETTRKPSPRVYQFDDDAPVDASEAPAAPEPVRTAPSRASVTEHTVKVAVPLSDDADAFEAAEGDADEAVDAASPDAAADDHRVATTPLIRDPHAAPTIDATPAAPFRPETVVNQVPPEHEPAATPLADGPVPSPLESGEDTDQPDTEPPSPHAAFVPPSPLGARSAVRTAAPPAPGGFPRALHVGWVAAIALVFALSGFVLGRITAPSPPSVAGTTDWAQSETLPTLVGLVDLEPEDPPEEDGGAEAGADAGADDIPEAAAPELAEAAVETEASEEASEVAEVEAAPPPATAKAARAPPPRQKQARRRPPQRQGRLTIIADHRAQVFIDGRDTGRHTPLQGYLVPVGRREVKLVAANGRTHVEEVVIRQGQVTQMRVAMR
jgi:hypothetical protein